MLACTDNKQIADPDFIPQNKHSRFSLNNAPVVLIDEKHHNFLTLSGRYKPFYDVLVSDGYNVQKSNATINEAQLNKADILVIANALDKNRHDWQPPYNNALSAKEVAAIKQWVLHGGSLFLVADHAPFPRFIKNLSDEFGFEFSNGHVANAQFNLNNKTLTAHVITKPNDIKNPARFAPSLSWPVLRRNRSNYVDHVRTFGGSAFKPPAKAISLLTLGDEAVSVIPTIPFKINSQTPRVSMKGWSQGAILKIGKGRVAVFSEGMMFSSQVEVKTGDKFGLTSPGADQNELFLLNVMAWLSKEI